MAASVGAGLDCTLVPLALPPNEPLQRSAAAEQLPLPPAGAIEPHYRREALQFLHVCLASVLNLRSPEDSELPGTPLDRLTEMLLGNQPPPHVLPTPSRVSSVC